MSDYIKKQKHIEKTLRELMELLPSTYNKESTDTNYYKLLRALSHELADARVKVEEVKDNTYLETVHPYAMYDNFGTLVKLSKSPDWDDEKYRSLIQSVIQSLLMGPTKESMIQAFEMFTQFNVNVYELYKDIDQLDPSVYQGYNPKYTFLLEIEKPLDVYSDINALRRDSNYIIGILKPAHTIGLQIVNLTDNENFRFYYAIDRQINNITKKLIEESIETKTNALIIENLDKIALEYADSHNIRVNEAMDAIYIQNYGMSKNAYLDYLSRRAQLLYNNYLASFATDKRNLNSNEGLIPTLTLDSFRNLVTGVSRREFDSTTNAKMISKVESKNNVIYNANIKIVSGENRVFSFIFNTNNVGTSGNEVKIDEVNKTLKLINKKTNEVISSIDIQNMITIGDAFNLRVEFTQDLELEFSGNVKVFINEINVIDTILTGIRDRYYGFQSGRDTVKISNFTINGIDTKSIEQEYSNVNSDNFWFIPNQTGTNIPSGTWYELNASKYLSVQGLIDKEFLTSYKNDLYNVGIGELNIDTLNEKIEEERNKLKDLLFKKQEDISLIDDDEWESLAVNSIKDKMFYDHIVEFFGGLKELYNYRLSEAVRFRDDLELFYQNNNQYIGMDKIEVESDNKHEENQFGWKHLSYKGQLMTSFNLDDGPKIGGTQLIGPRYTLYDKYILSAEHIYSEFIDFQVSANRISGRINHIILNDPLFGILPEEKEDLESYDVCGSGYRELYKTTEIGEENTNEFEIDYDELFEFSKYRNAFRLNYDMLNGRETWLDEDDVDKITSTELDLEEDIAFARNIKTFTLNTSLINSPSDIIGNYRSEHVEIEIDFGTEKYKLDNDSDEAIIEPEYNLSEHFFMGPIRNSFKLNIDKLNLQKIHLWVPDNFEMGTEFSEDIKFTENTKIRLNQSHLNSSDRILVEKEFFEVGLEHDEEYEVLNNVQEDSTTTMEYHEEDEFEFSKYRNAFRLNYDMLNGRETYLTEEDVDVETSEIELEENVNFLNRGQDTILVTTSSLNSKRDVINATKSEDFELYNEFKEDIGKVNESETISTEFEEHFRFSTYNIFTISDDKLNTQDRGIGLGQEHLGHSVELVMSKLDSDGNEIIIERRII